jgi:hypothetical protein
VSAAHTTDFFDMGFSATNNQQPRNNTKQRTK